jgi:hypothetical protein
MEFIGERLEALKIFLLASRACSSTLPGSSRRNSTQRDAPHPALIHQV